MSDIPDRLREHAVNRAGGCCEYCNGHKWAAVSATDPETRKSVPLFHPRRKNWPDHFCWSPTNEFEIDGLTPCGRATVERLKMNDPEIVGIRRILDKLGIRFRHRQ